MHNNSAYNGLLALLYDQCFSLADGENDFYRYFLHLVPGPALEVGCGTGQILIPLIQDGFDIIGLDSSKRMLELCRQKGNDNGLDLRLLHQPMQTLKLDTPVKTIYIPACSFMYILDINQAEMTIRRFYENLMPGGQLLLSLFIPWHDRESKNQELVADINQSDEQKILLYRCYKYRPLAQIRTGYHQFDVYDQGRLSLSEMHILEWRWYGINEFSMMLSKAGFKIDAVYGDYTLTPSDEDSYVVIFRAVRL